MERRGGGTRRVRKKRCWDSMVMGEIEAGR